MIDSIVPPGQHPPLAIVTDTDHTAWIIIATTLGLAVSVIFGAIRVYVKCSASSKKSWGYDDIALATATALAFVQSVLVLSACSYGLGQSIERISPGMVVKVQQLYYTNILVFIVCLGLSKASVPLFLLGLTSISIQKRIFRTASALLVPWSVVFLVALALQCDMMHPWITIGQACPGSSIRWQVFCATDIAFELSLIGMAVYFVWDIHTSNSRKRRIIFGFCFRLPMIIPILFRLKSFSSHGFTTNPTLLQSEFIVWTQTEMNYSLISATIPCIRSFVKVLATNYGGFGLAQNDDNSYWNEYGNRTFFLKQSHPMSNLNSFHRTTNPQSPFMAGGTCSTIVRPDHNEQVEYSRGWKNIFAFLRGFLNNCQISRQITQIRNESQEGIIISREFTLNMQDIGPHSGQGGHQSKS